MGVLKAYTFSSTWPWCWWRFETFQRLPRHETSPTIHRASFVVLTISWNWHWWYWETRLGSSAHKAGLSSSLHRLSKSRLSAVGVSYIRKNHLPDWTQIKSHTTTPSSFAFELRSSQEGMLRLVYLRRAMEAQILHFNESERQPRSSKEGKVALQQSLYRI